MTALDQLIARRGRLKVPWDRHTSAPARRSPSRLALVYRGPASLPGCPEAVAELLSASALGLRVDFVGPDEARRLSAASLAGAIVYAQPGGADLDDAYRHMRPHRKTIRQFVSNGGRYLGFCLGGYLAGSSPGFDLLPGDSEQYIGSTLSTVHTDQDTVVEVSWRGRRRRLYFQDGPLFRFDAGAEVGVLATYPNHTVAAAVTRFGRGRVGVVGPHPEAEADWFTDSHLLDPACYQPDPAVARGRDLGLDLLDEVMRP
ncbi:BPL-N domain-containing protein [Mycobacterium sp. URHB0021]|jgi:biotin protein ligase-like protein